MTTHDPRPPQWPPTTATATATATYEYLAPHGRTAPTTPGADQQVWQLVRAGGRGVLEEPAAGIVLVDPDLTAADFDGAIPVVTGR